MGKERLNDTSRHTILVSLAEQKSISEIAQETGKSYSTIIREIDKHYIVRRTGGGGLPFNECKNRFRCNITSLCDGCFDRKCKKCNVQRCSTLCQLFSAEKCELLRKPPRVCNGCRKRGLCTLEKHFYDANAAQKEYETVWSESHTGITLSEQEIERIDGIISPLMKQGQSVNCIMADRKDELMISQSTLYRYVDASLFRARNLDLPRKVRFAKRKKKLTLKINRSCREGRSYEDFKTYMQMHPGTGVVQLDSVEGTKGGKVLLTVHIVSCELMLMFLRDYNDAASVTACIDMLYEKLGRDTFITLFPVFLADNGSEFSDPVRIEFDWSGTGEERSRLFYCNPSAPYQKGSCERNHEFIRQIIPKGTSLSDFQQSDIDLVVDHISSYPRPSLGNKTPYELFSYLYGEDVLYNLGVHRIDPQKVTLRPFLLKGASYGQN